ncbi:MAG TPA: carboxypeptidase-like regulatory domain-containing protein [Terracidiphilus sp.]|nr:carboxypeptidase-like regulatory domain-containing protein [Terracidiphilus sp.]
MKRTIPLWLGLLAFAIIPAFAQTTPTTPAPPKGPTGKIHGHITNPTGAPQKGGTVTLVAVGRAASGPGLSAQMADKGVFQVDDNGDYAGEAAPGTYSVVYRDKNMKQDQSADQIDNVKILAGQDTLQDIDMSRKEYIDKLPAEDQKKLEELKKKNAEILKTNEGIKHLNDDLKLASQDFKDADNAHAIAIQLLGATASKEDLEAKETEIRTAKYTEVETLMLRDTAAKPDASVLWADLGQAQLGLKKYDEAITTYKKVLDVEAASKKPNPQAQGAANAGLGEIYARTGKVPEAQAAFDAAAKINPSQAGLYYKNEAVIFFQTGNADAQAVAADQGIKADPKNQPILYYLKGQGLLGKATVDPKTNMIILPDDCIQAFHTYLQLAPTGQFANEVRGIFAQAANSKTSKK